MNKTSLLNPVYLDDTFTLHQQGRLDEAEVRYLALLQLDPQHFDAQHMLGVIAMQRGQYQAAYERIQTALALNPAKPMAHSNLGIVLRCLQRPQDALPHLQQAAQALPNHAGIHHNLGIVLHNLRRPADALPALDHAVQLQPDYAEAHYYRGLVLLESQQFVEALAAFDHALTLQPTFIEAQHHRAVVLYQLQRYSDALAGFERVLQAQPDNAETWANHAAALLELERAEEALSSISRALRHNADDAIWLNTYSAILRGLQRWSDALAACDRALALNPTAADTHNQRGIVLRELRRLPEALAGFDQALQYAPNHVDAWLNRGVALRELQQLEDSLTAILQALHLKPDDPAILAHYAITLRRLDRIPESLGNVEQALKRVADPQFLVGKPHKRQLALAELTSNHAVLLHDLQRFDEALQYFEQAIALAPTPDWPNAHANRSLCYLVTGDFARGWPEFEWRWQFGEQAWARRDFSQPQWLGDVPLRGKVLLLHAEQGFGDTIQFCRYARLAAEQGAIVYLEVQPELKDLLAGLAGTRLVLAQGEELPPFDYHCPLMSMPLACQTRLDTIPASQAYLWAEPKRVRQWDERLGNSPLARVGLVWSGRTTHVKDRQRSVPLALFRKLLAQPAQFISLQKEVRSADEAELARKHRLRDFRGQLSNFTETAALIANLDLVIAVDTAVAHLAAALGRPVWLLLAFDSNWRWLTEREDSPWYPTIRLFRQTQFGDWNSVIDRIGEALRQFIHAKT